MADSAVHQKNNEVSRRDEMLHRQKVFWVLFTKPDLDVSYQKFKTSEASSSSAFCCCNSDWRQKHKQCSRRVSLLDVNDFDECRINQIRGDNKVGRQLESVHLEPEIF
jgi:hypothetical protein